MRNPVFGAILASLAGAVLAAPALAQDGARTRPSDTWTYVVLSDGTVGWNPDTVFRHPDGRITVQVMSYFDTPRPVPASATHSAKSSGAGQLYELEAAFLVYSCTGTARGFEAGMLFSVTGDHAQHVADLPPRPSTDGAAKMDTMIRDHVCRGQRPADSAEAKSTGELINIAVARKRMKQ